LNDEGVEAGVVRVGAEGADVKSGEEKNELEIQKSKKMQSAMRLYTRRSKKKPVSARISHASQNTGVCNTTSVPSPFPLCLSAGDSIDEYTSPNIPPVMRVLSIHPSYNG
jgi:hypothetical protein